MIRTSVDIKLAMVINIYRLFMPKIIFSCRCVTIVTPHQPHYARDFDFSLSHTAVINIRKHSHLPYGTKQQGTQGFQSTTRLINTVK